MSTQSITVELSEETIRSLTALGKPSDVLARLAHSAADGLGRTSHRRANSAGQREHTDASLRTERETADARDADKLAAIEHAADAVVRTARQRADQVVLTAREVADGERVPPSTPPNVDSVRLRARADDLVEAERSSADAVVEQERAERRGHLASAVTIERRTTDDDLTGERAKADTVLVDQREANTQMVNATIRAHEMADELRAVAEFRELFIGIVGHDLRNPLSSIVMAAGLLLQRGRLDDQDAWTAARIVSSSQRMTRLISRLLDLTRVRLGGGLPIEPVPTDLHEVCRNVVEEFEATIQLEVEGDMMGTWDGDRLAQVLSNLTGNAIEYARRGTAVMVKARAEGADVVVEVSNEGDPIPADVLPFIFEPFRRAKQREKSATGNLGLGLYIAKQIVLAHGGTLETHSADGMTVFVMRLPRQPPPPPG
jgi:signal transduction histidine kinase